MDDEAVQDEGVMNAGTKDLGDTYKLLIEIFRTFRDASNARLGNNLSDQIGIT